jgi:hypothetical protein
MDDVIPIGYGALTTQEETTDEEPKRFNIPPETIFLAVVSGAVAGTVGALIGLPVLVLASLSPSPLGAITGKP